MPLYDYRCQVCDAEVQVLRSLSEHDKLPEEHETSTTEDHAHDWVKQLGAVRTIKGRSWGPGKGHW